MSKTKDEVQVDAVAADAAQPSTVEEVKPRKTTTNWRVFEDAGYIPVRIRCDGFKSTHPSDLSCHTNFAPSTENILRHMDPLHGGGWFRIKFRISDGKKSPIWRELEEAGVELQDFHCPHCRADIAVSPRRILYHLQNHPGAIRVNLDPQVLCMELGYRRAEVDENSDLYE